MKTNKAKAFWAGMAFLSMGWVSAALTNQLGPVADGILFALVAIIASYQGTNVADNFIKGKHYRPELEGK